MYSAQLEVAHSALPDPSDPVVPTNSQKVTVVNLEKAVKNARPSVSESDRARYNKIYDKYKNSKGADFNPDGEELGTRTATA